MDKAFDIMQTFLSVLLKGKNPNDQVARYFKPRRNPQFYVLGGTQAIDDPFITKTTLSIGTSLETNESLG